MAIAAQGLAYAQAHQILYTGLGRQLNEAANALHARTLGLNPQHHTQAKIIGIELIHFCVPSVPP